MSPLYPQRPAGEEWEQHPDPSKGRVKLTMLAC